MVTVVNSSKPRHGQNVTGGDVLTRQTQEFFDVIDTVLVSIQAVQATSSELLDKSSVFNTSFKFLHKFNTTLGRPYFPSGSGALDPWVNSEGLVPLTPS